MIKVIRSSEDRIGKRSKNKCQTLEALSLSLKFKMYTLILIAPFDR